MANGTVTSSLTLGEIESALVGRLRSGGNGYYVAVLFSGVLMLVGAIAALYATVGGHHTVYNVTREIPWGVLISGYIFFVVTATGLCLVSSIGHIFGSKTFMPIAQRAVFLSIVTLMSGFFVILAEIKVPIRMLIYNIISPNFTSSIWWMGTLYGLALCLMIFEFIFLIIGRHRPAIACGFVALLAEIAAISNLAGVFGLLNGREFWHGPYLPIFFIASAMMVGASATIFFQILAQKVNGEPFTPMMRTCLAGARKVAILMICIILFFTIWRTVSTLVGMPNGQYVGVMAMLTGPYALSFWGGEILMALLAPLVLYLLSRGTNIRMMLIASGLMLIGAFFMRYNMVIVGQIIPVYIDLHVTGFTELLEYFPSANEIIITLGGFGLTGFLFLLGEKIFNGHKVEDH